MLYFFLGLLIVVLTLLAVAVCRAVLIKASAQKPYDFECSQKELDTAAEKLGAMVRIPTVSKREDEDLSEFYKLHAELERLFPRIHQKLEKTVLDGTLLYRWEGNRPLSQRHCMREHSIPRRRQERRPDVP